MVDKYIKSNMCMIPWTSINNTANGEFKPCCLWPDVALADDNGKQFDVRTNTAEQAMNSGAMQKLRDEFKQGKRPTGCTACWKVEDSGNKSKRQHMWEKAPTIGQIHLTKNIVKPVFLDIEVGNICNLKCRICSPGASSQWAVEMAKIDPTREKMWKKKLKQGAWPREENVFLKTLDESLPYVRSFDITGGEPLMIEEQFEMLRKCVSRGYAKNIEVHYNTNGTRFPEKALNEIWPHFKRVELAFSIDDIDDRFEYQRHPAKWQNVKSNILKFKNSGLPNLSMQICTTMNVFNIMYLDELALYIDEWQPDFWYINILHTPVEFDVQQLPADVKKIISKKLSKNKIRNTEIQQAIQYLNTEPGSKHQNYKQALTDKIKKIDHVRKQNFGRVFPLLNNLLRIYD